MKKKKLMMLLLLLILSMVVSKPAWAETVTIDLTSTDGLTIDSYGASGGNTPVSISKSGITISSNGGNYNTNSSPYRLLLYINKTFVVTSTVGNINQIDVTFNSEADASQLNNYTANTDQGYVP